MRKFLLLAGFVILAWIFVVPSCSTKFGCAAFGADAYAGSSDCPDSVDAAARNATWAQDRIRSIADESITTGLLYDEDGNEEKITSGRNGAYESALSHLKPYADSILRDKPPGAQAAEHVEVKAAAMLRDTKQARGVLVINNHDGPCGYASGIGCIAAIELVLPKGTTMDVWWTRGHQRYTGRAEV
jgi:SCP1.201-like deaminase